MWLTPSSTARRSTAIDWSRSLGVPFSKGRLPVSRIAPKPRRFTVRSPSCQVPAAAAGLSVEFTRKDYPAKPLTWLGACGPQPASRGRHGKGAVLAEPSVKDRVGTLAGLG